MKFASTIILLLLVFLAISSGIAKIVLMQQEVEFFGKHGFTAPVLIIFGASQLIGGVMLLIEKTRFFGAGIVATTFLVSLVLLLLDGNIPMSIVTAAATLLLGVVMKQSWSARVADSQVE
jgi:hypothetical protein